MVKVMIVKSWLNSQGTQGWVRGEVREKSQGSVRSKGRYPRSNARNAPAGTRSWCGQGNRKQEVFCIFLKKRPRMKVVNVWKLLQRTLRERQRAVCQKCCEGVTGELVGCCCPE